MLSAYLNDTINLSSFYAGFYILSPLEQFVNLFGACSQLIIHGLGWVEIGSSFFWQYLIIFGILLYYMHIGSVWILKFLTSYYHSYDNSSFEGFRKSGDLFERLLYNNILGSSTSTEQEFIRLLALDEAAIVEIDEFDGENLGYVAFCSSYEFTNKVNRIRGQQITTDLSSVMVSNSVKVIVFKRLYFFIKNLIINQINVLAGTPLILSVFLLIITFNIIGLLPYTFTLSAQLLITLTFSMFSFLVINFNAFIKYKLQFFRLFLPATTPLYIAPFLILIEMISYISRIISLAVRLFANMVAGHALLKILSGFAFSLIFTFGVYSFFGLLTLFIVVLVSFLELLIAFLQAYVFVVLLLIYIHELEVLH